MRGSGTATRSPPATASALLRAAAWAAALLAAAAPVPAPAADLLEVDLELVLAVDVSGSMDWDEAILQRDGYIQALTNPELIEIIQGGQFGRIAVTYVEWAGSGIHRQLIPWMLIDGPETARAFVNELAYANLVSGRGTSISGAITIASAMFAANDYDGGRWVVDVSGDGANNNGINVALAREQVLDMGITINGLPILSQRGGNNNLADLDVYYEECVIGGPGAFVISAHGFEVFGEAILRKLILEIAGLQPLGGHEAWGVARAIPAQAVGGAPYRFLGEQRYAPMCNIGEMMRGRGFNPPPENRN